MMTRSQLKKFITEVVLLFIFGAAIVIAGYFISQNNAEKRVQSEYHTRFDSVLDSYSYKKVKSKALEDFPEIDGVYIGYSATGIAEGYVIDLTVKSLSEQDLSMLVALDYESTRVVGLTLNPGTGENDYTISDSEMELIRETVIGRQIPIAFETEDSSEDDDASDKVAITGLHDGVYYAQRLFDDRNKYIDYVEMEVSNGVITKVKWDAFSTDKTNQDRSEASLRGAYEISGLDWATQSYNLCHALLECQNPDNLAMKSNGTTDIVDGVTCDIRPFVELAKECINNAKAGYDKDDYMNGINAMLTSLYDKNSEELGYTNSDGHIVFSFEKTPEIYTIYNDDEVAVGVLEVRQIEAKIRGASDPSLSLPDAQDNGDASGNDINSGEYDYSEDGLTSGGDADEQIFTDSLDDLPMSEMASFIEPAPDCYEQTRTVVKACNTCYKFLKEYMNWKV